MTDDVTVEQKMVKDYIVVSPDLAASKAQEELTLAGASYCVVISSDEKEPLTIVTSEQLKGLPDQTSSLADELVNLPPAVIVEPTRTMDQIVDDFSPLLLGERAIRGLLVQGGGQIEGILRAAPYPITRASVCVCVPSARSRLKATLFRPRASTLAPREITRHE